MPPSREHLRRFGLAEHSSDPAVQLARLVNLEETLAECEDPREVAELKNLFPSGLKSRSILRLEFMNAGMGGSGTIDLGVLYKPKTGIHLLCWLDLENSGGEFIASFDLQKTLWAGGQLIECALNSLGLAAVQNDAISQIENLAPREIPREGLRTIWAQVALKQEGDVKESLALFDRYYSERDKVLSMSGV
jgi:hypothetical protein